MISKKRIKSSLIDQLRFKGADIDCLVDLIDDYMALWEVKNKLIQDIEERGVTFKDFSSAGVEMNKSNVSVKDLVAVNKQMMQMLKDLDLSADKVIIKDEDDKL